ncbi:MAG: helix-turn-helix transcriptional regulator [Patulibacter sp.]|nr:helix-turn-helix transcriptional regulator [Patulibacter sp.]
MPADPRLVALGTAIREARNQARLSQEALATETGVDRSYFGHVERGLQNPSYLVLRRIADGLGITLDELVGRALKLDD